MALETNINSTQESTKPLPLLRPSSNQHLVYAKVQSVENLTTVVVERMYQLMHLHYDNVDFEQFKTDLLEKNHVILLRDKESHIIQGFSTLLKVPMTVNNQKVIGVYSGDTVLNKNYWGTSALGKAFLKYLWQVKITHLTTPVYWFLISKGYKTYLLMANNFKTHYPRFEEPTPPHFQKVMNTFYSKKFVTNYLAEKDLIHFQTPSCHLKENVADISEAQLKLPRVQFFQKKNPNWKLGDELTCIAEMTLWMPMTYAIKKLIKGLLK